MEDNVRIWAALAVLFGLFQISKSKTTTTGKPSQPHRKFYREGVMRDEMDALDAMNGAFEAQERAEKGKG